MSNKEESKQEAKGELNSENRQVRGLIAKTTMWVLSGNMGQYAEGDDDNN